MMRPATKLKLSLVIGLLITLIGGENPLTAIAQERESGRDRIEERGDERRSRWRDQREDRTRGGNGDRGRRRGSGRDRGNNDRGDNDGDSDRDRSSSSSSSAAETSNATSSGSGIDTRAYARSLIAQNDKDGNKMLSGDELAGLRGLAAQADLNNDGTIVSDELVAKLSGQSSGETSSVSVSGTAGSTESRRLIAAETGTERNRSQSDRDRREARGATDELSARKLTNGDRKFYRFKTGKDRAPSGLPSYFSRDANGDGQISMHEYASTWNDRTARTFCDLDLNSDGIITAKEALKQK